MSEIRAYRILLNGGPCDGQSLFAQHPWFQCGVAVDEIMNYTLNDDGIINEDNKATKWLYEAECGDDGQPIMEDGDQGEGCIEVIMCDTGDNFSPPVSTIRMTFSGKKWEARETKGE